MRRFATHRTATRAPKPMLVGVFKTSLREWLSRNKVACQRDLDRPKAIGEENAALATPKNDGSM